MIKSEKADLIRLKYKYRRLIMTGKMKLPPGKAARLIGPDCAYHLYSTYGFKISEKNTIE
jgi:hypothetical protein